MNRVINKFPFTESSTFLLDSNGYKAPLGFIIDANFYPRCDNNQPFHISSITGSRGSSVVKLNVSDSAGKEVFSIIINYKQVSSTNYVYGHGSQSGTYCGSCVCDAALVTWLSTTPNILTISDDSLVFSATAISPIPSDSINRGELKFNGEPVTKIVFGEGIPIGNNQDSASTKNTLKPINKFIVNGVSIEGDNIYITPAANSIVRILNRNDSLIVGRVTDL